MNFRFRKTGTTARAENSTHVSNKRPVAASRSHGLEAPHFWFKASYGMWCATQWCVLVLGYFELGNRNGAASPLMGVLSGGLFMTVLGYGIVVFHDHIANGRAQKLAEFVRRIAGETAI